MPTTTYTPLANVTLSSSTATVTFSSIVQSFRDIIAVASVKGAEGKIRISVNSVGSYLYHGVLMEADGGTAASNYGSDGYVLIGRNNSGIRNDVYTNIICNFNEYSVSGKHKPIIFRAGSNLSGVFAGNYRVATSSTISSIIFQLENGNFDAGSTFELFGVNA